MMKSRLILALSMAALAWPAGAASVAKTYSYFSIGGSTLEEIQQQLDVRGPQVKTTGRRHPGATQMEFTSRVGYAERDGGCAVAKANVTVKVKVILPRWTRPGRAEEDVRLVWDTLSSDIKRHEESHVVIAKNHARLLEQALQKIGKQRDCATAQAKAKERHAKNSCQARPRPGRVRPRRRHQLRAPHHPAAALPHGAHRQRPGAGLSGSGNDSETSK